MDSSGKHFRVWKARLFPLVLLRCGVLATVVAGVLAGASAGRAADRSAPRKEKPPSRASSATSAEEMKPYVNVVVTFAGATSSMQRALYDAIHTAAAETLADVKDARDKDAAARDFSLAIDARGTVEPAAAKPIEANRSRHRIETTDAVAVGVRNGKMTFTMRSGAGPSARRGRPWTWPLPAYLGEVEVSQTRYEGGGRSRSVSVKPDFARQEQLEKAVHDGLLAGLFRVEFDKNELEKQLRRPGSLNEERELTCDLKITNQSPWAFKSAELTLYVQEGVTLTVSGVTFSPDAQATQTVRFKFKRVKGTRLPILGVVDIDGPGK